MKRSRRGTVQPALADWIALGRTGVRAGPVLRGCVSSAVGVVRSVLPTRVRAQRWIHYYVDLTGSLPALPPEVRLTRVTDEVIAQLRAHPEAAENQLKSGLRFWDHGLRRAYIWMDDHEPLCIQWLLTHTDHMALRSLPEWAGMYPPLPRGIGQVENLFAFATARRQGVASRFEYALYHEARRHGLTRLVTHIHEPNTAARGWADRTGWQRSGTITRVQVDLPWFRGRSLYVHRQETAAPAPALVLPPSRVHARTA